MKHCKLRLATFFTLCTFVFCFTNTAFAKTEWEFIKEIYFEGKPLDIAVSKDGAYAYILCEESIQVYSKQENKVTDIIPLKDEFSKIVISSEGGELFLTNKKNKKLAIIKISQSFDIEIGASPIIGRADVPVGVFVFMDYQ